MVRGQRAPGRGAGPTEAKQPVLVYAVCRHKDGDAPDVITDIGSTHSYVASAASKTLGLPFESTSSEITVLLFEEFDLILGIDWLVKHRVSLDYAEKRIVLRTEKVAENLVRKGYEAYLAYISVADSEGSSIKDIRTVRDFPNVFLEELPGLPSNREVEFRIELIPGTAPVSIAPYRMALKELIELKAQIQELLDRGFIRPSMSP
ncbi:uncharacterized protein [Gossypium hirsutum]|uniref:RVP_2 domain-containing protein n=1 Tax=Gossypium hirsutum TaxID=3635 RepID=A0A1U8PVX9_GOSHI|nr:uncharacterized protein LOC107963226 [Gossypium hirsutum]